MLGGEEVEAELEKARVHNATLRVVTPELEELFLRLAQAESRYRNFHYRAKDKPDKYWQKKLADTDRQVRSLRLRITRTVAEAAWDQAKDTPMDHNPYQPRL